MQENQKDIWSSHARFNDGTNLYLDLKPTGALKVAIVKNGQRYDKIISREEVMNLISSGITLMND